MISELFNRDLSPVFLKAKMLRFPCDYCFCMLWLHGKKSSPCGVFGFDDIWGFHIFLPGTYS